MNRMQLAGIGVLAGALTIVGAVGPVGDGRASSSFAGTDANRGSDRGDRGRRRASCSWRSRAGRTCAGRRCSRPSRASSRSGSTIWTLAAINGFIGAPAGLPIGRGWGIWLAMIGSLVLVVAAFWRRS